MCPTNNPRWNVHTRVAVPRITRHNPEIGRIPGATVRAQATHVSMPMKMTLAPATIFATNHGVSVARIPELERVRASNNPATIELINARKREMVFMRRLRVEVFPSIGA